VLLAIVPVTGFRLFFTDTPMRQNLFGATPLGLPEWGILLLVAVNVWWMIAVEKWKARRVSQG